jgi:hypothetical protein
MEQLLREIEAYLLATGMSARTFGIEAVGDPALVYGIRKGRLVKLPTAERLRAFMAGHAPGSKAAE